MPKSGKEGGFFKIRLLARVESRSFQFYFKLWYNTFTLILFEAIMKSYQSDTAKRI